MTMLFPRTLAALCVAVPAMLMLAMLPPGAWADGGRERVPDQERARGALERGQVRPLIEILQMIEARTLGEIIETEIENEDGVWVYEIKYITKSGRMRKIYVDAWSGRIIENEDD